MTIFNLSDGNSVLNQFIAEIRDKDIQKNHMRFRRNLERIGEIFAYEISKTLNYCQKDITTPLGIAKCGVPCDDIVLATILRAGLPLHNGLLNYFDKAQNAFIAAYRKYGKDNKLSVLLAYQKLLDKGTPATTHLVCPIASCYGVEYLSKNMPHKNITLWVGAIDEELTNKSYIVPGLGDAGDLAFGDKL